MLAHSPPAATHSIPSQLSKRFIWFVKSHVQQLQQQQRAICFTWSCLFSGEQRKEVSLATDFWLEIRGELLLLTALLLDLAGRQQAATATSLQPLFNNHDARSLFVLGALVSRQPSVLERLLPPKTMQVDLLSDSRRFLGDLPHLSLCSHAMTTEPTRPSTNTASILSRSSGKPAPNKNNEHQSLLIPAAVERPSSSERWQHNRTETVPRRRPSVRILRRSESRSHTASAARKQPISR